MFATKNVRIVSIEKFANLIIFVAKKQSEVYITLLYQILFIDIIIEKNSIRYDTLQIEKLNISKLLREIAKIFSEILLNNLNTYDK